MSSLTIVLCNKLGAPRAELPKATLDEVGWSLNEIATCKFSIDPLSTNASMIRLEEDEVQVWSEDDLIWWGVIREMDGDFKRLTFTAEELFSYFHYRFVLLEDLIYEDIDQLTI